MALAEARAAWQRTANRCLVQEDAKRAPKLASCTSAVTSSVKQTESEPANADNNGEDIIPNTVSLPFSRTPSYSSLSPNSTRWLQMQPSYGYQKVLMDEQSSSPVEGQKQDPQSLEYKGEFIGCEGSKNADEDVYFFDSESSWVGPAGGKNTPWWRTADTEELALLVSQRSLDVLENCDLPMPLNSHVKKGMDMGTRRFSHDDNEISTLLLARKPGVGSLISGDCSQELRKPVGDRLVFGANSSSRQSSTNEKTQGDSSRAQLLEALRHSQTRAREAEEVMKKACAEKEHVVKLVIRQATQLFAYKQWVHLLQLENMYFQFKNSKSLSAAAATVSPVKQLPWTGLGNRKMQKGWPLHRKREKRSRASCDFGKYAIAFALGLGLVGAGILLGWTVGWMLPTW